MQYTFAWTIAALVMFIPANIYPMMVFYTLGNPDASTILEGIAIFIDFGMYPVALIIFIASFIVPLGKIMGLFVLIYNTKFNSTLTMAQKSKLYHLVEFLGPWSMLDVFVVAIMAGVVNLGFLTNVEAAMGITYFALMVVFTMIAAESFDARLLWDKNNNGNDND
ncbi:paraquat-inducible protein A [Thalassotalea atypica]|uniref:paraquat-inducible protein A n=1 Tax=Thalassotalea atypica TaxID=2054316 RepID=UPI0025740A4E|nr:paraquat-inducible protein A [Thalassotalea atypica]